MLLFKGETLLRPFETHVKCAPVFDRTPLDPKRLSTRQPADSRQIIFLGKSRAYKCMKITLLNVQ